MFAGCVIVIVDKNCITTLGVFNQFQPITLALALSLTHASNATPFSLVFRGKIHWI